MCNPIVPFYFKVECTGPGGDNYIAYWLVLSYDTKRALETLENSDNYKKSVGKAHPPEITQVDAKNILDNFNHLVFELVYDCYN